MASLQNKSGGANQNVEVSEDEFHRQIAILMTPGIIILGLLMLIGVFGNILVLYVRRFNSKMSTNNLFIMALAVSDIVVCSVCIPIEIVVMRYLYSFDNPWLCRVMRTIVLCCVFCSIGFLIAIAVDRYKRICTPFAKQITVRTAKIAIGIGCGVSAVLSTPFMVILGSKTVNATFIGHACSTDDRMIPTPYPGMFNGMQFLVAIISTSTVIILYTLIFRKVKIQGKYRKQVQHQKKQKQVNSESSVSGNITMNQSLEVRGPQPTLSTDQSENDSFSYKVGNENVTVLSGDESENQNDFSPRNSNDTKDIAGTKSKSSVWSGSYKTTYMMFLITAVFVVSFIPHLGLMATRAAQKHTFEHLRGVELGLYNLFLRTIFINSASNPIIYSFLNDKFRREAKRLFNRGSPKTTAV